MNLWVHKWIIQNFKVWISKEKKVEKERELVRLGKRKDGIDRGSHI